MAYPPPPWNTRGDALYTMRLVDIAVVRPLIPEPFRIVPLLPGKTLSSVYFADYQPGSDLVYHELIIAPAMVRLGRHIGSWISHIYVDSPDSMAGGREIWGLPKELARFEWDLAHGRVEAWQDDRKLCAFYSRPPGWKLPIPVPLPVLSRLGNHVLAFAGVLKGGLGFSRAEVEIPAGSPFAGYHLDGPARAYHHRNMTFQANGPRVVAQLKPAPAGSRA